MGAIVDEFEFLEPEEKETSIEEDSKRLVNYARYFIEKSNKFPNESVQGISVTNISKGITICESNIMPWEHVKFTLNVDELRDLNRDKLVDFSVPFFIEELESIGDRAGTEFGYNQTCHNNLRSVSIHKNVMIINSGTFLLYRKLENIIFEKDSKLLYLGPQAFVGCKSLHKIDLRNCTELETLANNLFTDSAVEVVKLNSNIQTISRRAFENSNVKTVYINEHKYKIEEFLDRLESNNYEPFWYSSKYMEDAEW